VSIYLVTSSLGKSKGLLTCAGGGRLIHLDSLWCVIESVFDPAPLPRCLIWQGQEEGSHELALNFTSEFGNFLLVFLKPCCSEGNVPNLRQDPRRAACCVCCMCKDRGNPFPNTVRTPSK